MLSSDVTDIRPSPGPGRAQHGISLCYALQSLCYQLPALLGGDSVVLVISPLISLMYDQVSGLATRNVQAATTADAEAEAMAMQGQCRLIYTTPETVLGRWKGVLSRLHNSVGIRLVAVDEAHCVSEVSSQAYP